MAAAKTLLVVFLAIAIIAIAAVLLSRAIPESFSFGDKIAVVKVEGEISSGTSFFAAHASPESVKKLLKQANSDPTIRAVLLEINSPGGAPVASDEIASAVEDMNKTIVAYIAEQGTSGAYWIAASADKIVAHPLAITCSIGAFTTSNDLSELFKKIGLNQTTIKSGELKDIGAANRPLTEKERALLQKLINDVKEAFIEHVQEKRNISAENIALLSDGRPCLGKDALNYGLVDKLGTKQDAIELIEKIENIRKPHIVELGEKENLLSSVFSKALTNGFYALGHGIGDAIVAKNNNLVSS